MVYAENGGHQKQETVLWSCTAWQMLHASTLGSHQPVHIVIIKGPPPWFGGGWGGGLAWRTLPGAEGHICHQHCHNANGWDAHLVGLFGGEACNGRGEVDAMVKHDM